MVSTISRCFFLAQMLQIKSTITHAITRVENKANKLDDWHRLTDEDVWPLENRKSRICEFRKQDYQRAFIYQKIGSQECIRQYGIKKNSI